MLIVGWFGSGEPPASTQYGSVQAARLTLVDIGIMEAQVAGQSKPVSASQVVGIVAADKLGSTDAKAFLQRWERTLGGQVPPLHELGANGSNGLVEWTTGLLSARLVMFAKDNRDLRRQVSELRRELEMLHRSASKMETFLHTINAGEFVSALTSPYCGSTVNLRFESPALTQIIQVSPLGIAGIDLFVDRAASDPLSMFEVSLRGQDTETEYGTWRVVVGDLCDDWTSFSLTRGLEIDADTLALCIRVATGEGLALGLGVAHPVASVCAHQGGSPVVDGDVARMLAMRVWRGAPRLPAPSLPRALLPSGAGGGAMRLPTRVLLDARLLDETGADSAEISSVVTESDGALSIQPNGDGRAYLLLRQLVPVGATEVSATLAVSSEVDAGVEVGLAAVALDEEGDAGERRALASSIAELSWTPLSRGRPEAVIASVNPESQTPQAVILAVRVQNLDMVWFASTRLLSLSVKLAGAPIDDPADGPTPPAKAKKATGKKARQSRGAAS